MVQKEIGEIIEANPIDACIFDVILRQMIDPFWFLPRLFFLYCAETISSKQLLIDTSFKHVFASFIFEKLYVVFW